MGCVPEWASTYLSNQIRHRGSHKPSPTHFQELKKVWPTLPPVGQESTRVCRNVKSPDPMLGTQCFRNQNTSAAILAVSNELGIHESDPELIEKMSRMTPLKCPRTHTLCIYIYILIFKHNYTIYFSVYIYIYTYTRIHTSHNSTLYLPV